MYYAIRTILFILFNPRTKTGKILLIILGLVAGSLLFNLQKAQAWGPAGTPGICTQYSINEETELDHILTDTGVDVRSQGAYMFFFLGSTDYYRIVSGPSITINHDDVTDEYTFNVGGEPEDQYEFIRQVTAHNPDTNRQTWQIYGAMELNSAECFHAVHNLTYADGYNGTTQILAPEPERCPSNTAIPIYYEECSEQPAPCTYNPAISSTDPSCIPPVDPDVKPTGIQYFSATLALLLATVIIYQFRFRGNAS